MPTQSEANMKSDKRFEVSIPIEIKIEEVVDGKCVPFTDFEGGTLRYHDIGYDGIVAVQAAMTELLDRLNGFGFDKAQAMGLGEKLKALGVTKK